MTDFWDFTLQIIFEEQILLKACYCRNSEIMTFYFLGTTVSKKSQLSYLLNSFILSKIDDTVAADADTTKLMDLGLVYGDIISYRQMFQSTSTPKVASYKERAQELKMKIQRTHSGRDETTDPY